MKGGAGEKRGRGGLEVEGRKGEGKWYPQFCEKATSLESLVCQLPQETQYILCRLLNTVVRLWMEAKLLCHVGS